ncbi:hypothetical protein OEG84_09445 [Hoeflea sp. G2-23]|uniref:N-acetyltransferase domain-containing protein n=1 Tax=Hoeflea algicola TaxID=2983763 RepID=A0ABT3Z819_9HYPH|nr:hypothetical protein [Hoeflea algicola]MCY0147928.1 hypothetical protein [Hoeflea algicola]
MKSILLLKPLPLNEPPTQASSPELEDASDSAKAKSVMSHLERNIDGITVSVGSERGRHQLAVRGSIDANVDLIFQENTADIGRAHVDPAFRGQGRCRCFTQQLHHAVRKIGFEKMTLKAVSEGRVAWATLGFRPTPFAWHLRKARFDEGFSEFRNRYSTDTAELIDGMISENDVNVFPVLANVNRNRESSLQYKEISATILCSLQDWGNYPPPNS